MTLEIRKNVSVYIYIFSIRGICQRRKFKGNFTYLVFLDFKKAYDSVPIFNILTKKYNLRIRGKCHLFLRNFYLSSKARALFNGNLSEEFFRLIVVLGKDAFYFSILFNLFINDALGDCDKYGVHLESPIEEICFNFLYSLVQIRLDSLKLIKKNHKQRDFIKVMDLNLVILTLVSMILLVN